MFYSLVAFFILFSSQLSKAADFGAVFDVTYFVDHSGSLSFAEISDESFQTRFESAEKLDFGLSRGRLWLKFRIDAKSVLNPLFVVNNPSIYELRFYQPSEEGGGWEIGRHGTSLKKGEVTTEDRLPTFEIHRNNPEINEYYIGYRDFRALTPKLEVRSEEAHLKLEQKEMVFHSGYVGWVLVMILYNLVLYFVLFDRSYIYYSLATVFVHGLVFSSVNGWLDGFSMFDAFVDRPDRIPVVVGAGMLFTGLFGMSFLSTKTRLPKLHIVHQAFCSAGVLVSALALFTDLYFLGIYGSLLSLAQALALTLTGFLVWRQGFFPAAIFLAAWGCVFLPAIFFILGSIGLVEIGFWVKKAPLIGAGMEALLLSVALGFRYKLTERDRIKLTSEVGAATLVQNSFLEPPKKVEGIDVAVFSRSAESSGGDWYGFYHDAKSNTYIAMCGDVTGHGLPASLISSIAGGSAQGFLANEFSKANSAEIDYEELLVELLKVVNLSIVRSGKKLKKAMTLTVAAFNLKSGKVWVSNAAHNHPLLITPTSLRTLPIPGSLLGVRSSALNFKVKQVDLEPGDVFLIHSDGLVENTGQKGETLELGGTLEEVRDKHLIDSSSEILGKILSKGELAWGLQPPEDDCTIVVLKWEGDLKVRDAV